MERIERLRAQKKPLENIPAPTMRSLRLLIPSKLPKKHAGADFRILQVTIQKAMWTVEIILKDGTKLNIKGTEKLLE